MDRLAAEIVARELLDAETEVTVLLPRREYSSFRQRLFHDHTADAIAKPLAGLPHCNVTIVPFHIGARSLAPPAASSGIDLGSFALPTDRTPIAELEPRQRARVAGKVYAVRVQAKGDTPTFELTLIDESGALNVAFFGRRSLAGVVAGTRIAVEGVVSEKHGRIAMLNPAYEILLSPSAIAAAIET